VGGGKYTSIFSARLSVMIPDVNTCEEHRDTNIKIGAEITEESPPSLDIAGISDNVF
jgi:hypothetical protein